MQSTILTLAFLVGALSLQAGDNPYQTQLQRLTDKVIRLSMRKTDPKGGTLSAAEEAERLRLTAQLREFDPIGTLLDELSDDIRLLLTVKEPAPRDVALVEERKTFLALAASLPAKAESLEHARTLADTARRLILRRDLDALKTLTRSTR